MEFEGEQRLLQTIWTDEVARIIGPLKATVENALGRAADLDGRARGLEGHSLADETETGAEWGFNWSTGCGSVCDLFGGPFVAHHRPPQLAGRPTRTTHTER